MRALLMAILLAAMPAGPTYAQESAANADEAVDATARRTRLLADKLRSPFCPGKTLLTCTSFQAYELRQEIRDLVAAGKSDEAIIADLKLRYGDEISNPPQPWYTILVPFLPFVFGLLLVLWVFHRWRKRGPRKPQVAADAPALEGADAERLARIRAQMAQDTD